MAKDCRKCKSYKDCTGKDFFTFAEIKFCPWQIMWVIEHSVTLLAGNWPANPDGSSYTDGGVQSGYKAEAYYVKPEEILAEVERRLKRTGLYGKLLVAEVEAGRADRLSAEAYQALMYVKGFRRKQQSFNQWRADRRYKSDKIICKTPST